MTDKKIKLSLEVDGRKIEKVLILRPEDWGSDKGRASVSLYDDRGEFFAEVLRHEYSPETGKPIVDIIGFEDKTARMLNELLN